MVDRKQEKEFFSGHLFRFIFTSGITADIKKEVSKQIEKKNILKKYKKFKKRKRRKEHFTYL